MSKRSLLIFLAAVLFLYAPAGSGAVAAEGTGLPLPRFASLRADEVNMRTGPGVQYPVEWVYHRKRLPVEIIAEYATWRKVRDWQGAQGWLHRSMLDGERTIIVTGNIRSLRKKDDVKSEVVARAEPGVIGILLMCPDGSGWCQIEADGHKGWLRRVDFWGIHRDEVME
ncbi:MAG: SH3 domain-containing protein [Rhodospirillales bacterium]